MCACGRGREMLVRQAGSAPVVLLCDGDGVAAGSCEGLGLFLYLPAALTSFFLALRAASLKQCTALATWQCCWPHGAPEVSHAVRLGLLPEGPRVCS